MRRYLTTLTVLGMVLALTAPAFAQTSSDYFLHGTGPHRNISKACTLERAQGHERNTKDGRCFIMVVFNLAWKRSAPSYELE